MSLIKNIMSNAKEVRYAGTGGDPWSIPTNGSLGRLSSSGTMIDSNTAMSLAAVWTCVRIISGTVGSLRMEAFRKSDGILKLIDSTPSLLRNPFGNDYGAPLTCQVGLEQMMQSMLVDGDSINYITARDGNGFPTELLPLDPTVISIQKSDKGRKEYRIGGQLLDSDNVLHVLGMSQPGSIRGMSPISYLRQTIGLGLAAEEYGARFYSNGANMSGIIETVADLDADSARTLKERFTSRNTGLKNAHNVGLLTGGATFKPLGIRQTDMQFVETRQFNTGQIAAIYGVPPHLMGNTQDVSVAWGATPEQQGIAFLTYTLRPWLTRLEEAFSYCLPQGITVRFDVDDLLRTDATTRAAYYSSGRMAGWLLTDEIRAQENLKPVAGGDRLDQPLNSAHNGQNDGTSIPTEKSK